LETQFHVTPASLNEHYPGLPLLMSLIDTALDRRQSFHPCCDLDRMSRLREAIEFGIFDHLENRLMTAPTNNHWDLIGRLSAVGDEPRVISTNYDLIADTAMMYISENYGEGVGRLPDYRCHITATSTVTSRSGLGCCSNCTARSTPNLRAPGDRRLRVTEIPDGAAAHDRPVA
jgi:hypothetical protein